MATSSIKTNLFLTFEIATKWQNVCYTQRSYRLISLNQPKTMWHGCKHSSSWDNTRTVCCTEEDCIFKCLTECTDGHMLDMYLPGTNASVSRYFVHSFGHCGICQGVSHTSIPCCMHVNFVLC